jgi:hypothetical protein
MGDFAFARPAIISAMSDQAIGSPEPTPPPEPTPTVSADSAVPVPPGWQTTGMEIPQYRRATSHEAALMQPQSFFWPGVQDNTLAIRPTIYPAPPGDTVTVEDAVSIDRRSPEFREFIEQMDRLIVAVQGSNEIVHEVGEQLVAELRAGVEYIKAPKPSRKVLYLLPGGALSWAAMNFATNFMGELAKHAADLLIKLIGVN